MPPRLADRERNAGETRARADVGDARAGKQRLQCKAFDEVAVDELLGAARSREVIDAVPPIHEIQMERELGRGRSIAGDARRAEPRIDLRRV